VLRDADIAMYQAKGMGKACFAVFNAEMRTQAYSRLMLENDLRDGIKNHEFQLYYQPILSLETNQMVGLEALIRWLHPKRGLLLPADFLSLAEETGLILPLGEWTLNEACLQLKHWQQKYRKLQNLSVNVNIATRQFSQPNFINEVVGILNTSGLKANSLHLEITENTLIENYEAAKQTFTRLKDIGVQVQIDDFGSGYSALGYLQHFPVSTIKIDKSFIKELGVSQRGTELIRAIISMARELGMETIAEGIETGKQLSELKTLSCNLGQGFHLSRPLDKVSMERLLEKQVSGKKQ
jgi:EAL domain-containing protein (putative c-di-GMP-specific phosphodiesterase class I)